MHSLCGDDENLAAKCFGLCQALVSQNRSFSFALNVGSFSFSLDTRELASNKQKAEKKMKKKKKPSPSTIRRSARRKEEYLKKKALTPPGRITSDSSGKKEPGSVLPVQPKGSGSTPPSRPGRPLRILPSPSPASGRRRVTSCAGRLEVPMVLTPVLNLDGGEPSLPSPTSPLHTPSREAEVDEEEVKEEEEKEEEEILPHVLCDYGVHALHEFYAIPPAKIRHPYYGIGTFKSIDPGGRYLYDVGMENPIRVYNKPQAPKPYF